MSGIAGIIHFDGAPASLGLVEKMTAAIAHRGPDGIHHWVKGPVALGQCMLRTTPESLEERQPLLDEDAGLALVMDGRVDNWEALRHKLLRKGAVLRDRSDAELVLRAYAIWGRECLAHIEGDFALAIWDARRQEAFCARDRMGHKPFHYHWDGKTLAFASELSAILALPWVEQEPNEGMLAEFLTDEWYSRDETLWVGIMRLVAAHSMAVGNSGPRPELYWEPDLWAELPLRKDEDYVEYYYELLFDSVRRLSRSHKPVAIEVSGGLDSSAVFCVAEHVRREGGLPAPSIEGYTLAFTEDGDANEMVYARAVGEYLGLPIHEVAPSRMPLSWHAERASAEQNFPGYPNATMSVGIQQKAAAQGSRALLTGLGGDEWQGGSRAYYAEALAKMNLPELAACFKADAAAFGVQRAGAWLIRDGLLPLLPSGFEKEIKKLVYRLRGQPLQRDYYWLAPRMREIIRQRRDLLSRGRRQVRNIGQRDLLTDLYFAFDAMGKECIDNQIARSGMEMRHPLNDFKLVQFAFSTPTRLRLRGDTAKRLHVLALQDHMPGLVLERKTKAGFSIVFREYLCLMENIFTDAHPCDRKAWVDKDGMARLFRFYRDGLNIHWPMWVLWNFYMCGTIHV